MFLNYSHRHGWVREDLMVDIRPRQVPRVERLPLTADELVQFLDIPDDPRDRAFIAVAINTGLRSSEIIGLRIYDVNLVNGELYVYRWIALRSWA